MLIHAVFAVLALATGDAAMAAASPSRDEIVPVVRTVKKLPDLGEPHENNLRRHW